MISITEFFVCIWGALELVFVGVTMLYLAPRINRLESPAKVSTCLSTNAEQP